MIKNKVVAISGGSGLIGKTFIEAIIKEKSHVIVGDITNTPLEECLLLYPESISYLPLDVTSKASIITFISQAKKLHQQIDAVIHCAYPRSKQWGCPFEDLEEADLKDDLYNQLGGAILFSQQWIKYFKTQGFGNMIHISSIQGLAAPKFHHYEGTTMVSPIEYSAIKSGINAIVKYLAKYLKNTNIRVNGICPGGILDQQPELFLEKYKKDCCSKGMLTATDLCGTLIYLLSDMSQYVTGQNLVVDDGWVL